MLKLNFSNNIDYEDKVLVGQYCQFLSDRSVQILLNISHLACALGVTVDFLYRVSNSPSYFYRAFTIKKNSGGVRELNSPLPNLSEVQTWILQNILENRCVGKSAMAYRKGYSIKKNARIHRGQNYLLKLDIENFFDNITYSKVFSVFHDIGYTYELSSMLSRLCTFKGVVPQGAPTSGILANLVMVKFDQILLREAIERGFRYTRYSDDICLSGRTREIAQMIDFVMSYLSYNGFKLNSKKTALISPGQRKIVTGLVVNENVSPRKEVVADLRQQHYYIMKFGVYSHASVKGWGNIISELSKLIGIASFLVFVRPKNLYYRKIHSDLLAEQRKVRTF